MSNFHPDSLLVNLEWKVLLYTAFHLLNWIPVKFPLSKIANVYLSSYITRWRSHCVLSRHCLSVNNWDIAIYRHPAFTFSAKLLNLTNIYLLEVLRDILVEFQRVYSHVGHNFRRYLLPSTIQRGCWMFGHMIQKW